MNLKQVMLFTKKKRIKGIPIFSILLNRMPNPIKRISGLLDQLSDNSLFPQLSHP